MPDPAGLDRSRVARYRTYVLVFRRRSVSLTLTELRQSLFKLADQVVDTGVPLVIERRGVRLRLIREDAPVAQGRLQLLQAQPLVLGAPLQPDESPAAWSELPAAKVAEGAAVYSAPPAKATRSRRKSRPQG